MIRLTHKKILPFGDLNKEGGGERSFIGTSLETKLNREHRITRFQRKSKKKRPWRIRSKFVCSIVASASARRVQLRRSVNTKIPAGFFRVAGQ